MSHIHHISGLHKCKCLLLLYKQTLSAILTCAVAAPSLCAAPSTKGWCVYRCDLNMSLSAVCFHKSQWGANAACAYESIIVSSMLMLADLERAEQEKTLGMTGLLKRGCLKHLLADKIGAAADFDMALQAFARERQTARHLFALSVLCYTKGDLQGALKHVNKAYLMDPEEREFLRHRGIVKHLLGDHMGAVTDLRRCEGLNVVMTWKLAAALVHVGDYYLADQYINNAEMMGGMEKGGPFASERKMIRRHAANM